MLNRLSATQLHRIGAYTLPVFLAILIIFFTLMTPQFLSLVNLMLILNDATVTGIIAVGMTFVLILGGIDLSVASNATLTTVVLSFLLVKLQLPLGLAVGISILPGCLLGLGNGLLVVKARVPAIIVSLGTASIVQSIASFVTQGAITSLGDFQTLTTIGQGMLFGVIPVPVLIFLCIALVSSILLTRTPFGAYVRAIGGNIRASKLMGIRVALNQICVYVLSGLLAAIAGIIVAGRLSMGSSQAGSGLELPAIAAAVLGGSSLSGGSGTIIGTLVGTLILSVVFNGIILIGVPFFYQFVVTGVVVLLAVALNEAIRQVT